MQSNMRLMKQRREQETFNYKLHMIELKTN